MSNHEDREIRWMARAHQTVFNSINPDQITDLYAAERQKEKIANGN